MSRIESVFGKLYLKEKKLNPEFCEVSIDYGRMSVHVDYQLKEGRLQTEVIPLESAFDLLAKRILEVERHFVETQDTN